MSGAPKENMNIFILCTGRSGSSTFIEACKHITNYSSGHESQASKLGEDRLAYPGNHIEADNRLSWMLGPLDDKYGDSAIYIHLTRNKEDTVKSFNRRWSERTSIVRAYSEGVLKIPVETLSKTELAEVCANYYDTVNTNILHFLSNKSQVLTVSLEEVEFDFTNFWEQIHAEGDLDLALKELATHHNPSGKKRWVNYGYSFKLLLLRLKIAILGR